MSARVHSGISPRICNDFGPITLIGDVLWHVDGIDEDGFPPKLPDGDSEQSHKKEQQEGTESTYDDGSNTLEPPGDALEEARFHVTFSGCCGCRRIWPSLRFLLNPATYHAARIITGVDGKHQLDIHGGRLGGRLQENANDSAEQRCRAQESEKFRFHKRVPVHMIGQRVQARRHVTGTTHRNTGACGVSENSVAAGGRQPAKAAREGRGTR